MAAEYKPNNKGNGKNKQWDHKALLIQAYTPTNLLMSEGFLFLALKGAGEKGLVKQNQQRIVPSAIHSTTLMQTEKYGNEKKRESMRCLLGQIEDAAAWGNTLGHAQIESYKDVLMDRLGCSERRRVSGKVFSVCFFLSLYW